MFKLNTWKRMLRSRSFGISWNGHFFPFPNTKICWPLLEKFLEIRKNLRKFRITKSYKVFNVNEKCVLMFYSDPNLKIPEHSVRITEFFRYYSDFTWNQRVSKSVILSYSEALNFYFHELLIFYIAKINQIGKIQTF